MKWDIMQLCVFFTGFKVIFKIFFFSFFFLVPDNDWIGQFYRLIHRFSDLQRSALTWHFNADNRRTFVRFCVLFVDFRMINVRMNQLSFL